MKNTIYKNKIRVVVFACNEYNLIGVVKNCHDLSLLILL